METPIRHSLIAREGWLFIGLALLIAYAVYLLTGFPVSVPLWGLALLLIYMFRDPPREIPPTPLAVLSPADGRVEMIDHIRDPYLNREAVRIGVQIGVLDVYSARSPVEGKIAQQWFVAGREGGKKEDERPRYAQWISTDEGDDVVLMMYAGPWTHRPHCYVHSGERVGQGQRCGYIRFGARVDVLIPSNSRVEVKPGEPVKAGSDIIAHLVHR